MTHARSAFSLDKVERSANEGALGITLRVNFSNPAIGGIVMMNADGEVEAEIGWPERVHIWTPESHGRDLADQLEKISRALRAALEGGLGLRTGSRRVRR